MTQKIAIVVQRYGLEVNGGAELHARLLAEQLSTIYEIEVLTTTALDYYGWENHYMPGTETINGICVYRFKTVRSSKRKLRKGRRAIWGNKKYFKLLKRIGLLDILDRKFGIRTPTEKDVKNWLISQGPYCPDLTDYIKANKQTYDAFIFFTYLYYPTAVGMRIVPEKSIFIPTAHDEAIMFTKPYEDIFSVPAFIMYNTLAEKRLVESKFSNVVSNSDIAGIGFSNSDRIVDDEGLLEKMGLSTPYFVYIGRIDENKGCDHLMSFFEEYITDGRIVKLVMIGKDYMGIEGNDQILLTGFVDDHIKTILLKYSVGLIIPSSKESLSMVTLEAMGEGKTVIVNEKSEVLKDHVLNSGIGYYYKNYEEFKIALDKTLALTDNEKASISERAKSYVQDNYSWDNIIKKFKIAIENIVDGKYKKN